MLESDVLKIFWDNKDRIIPSNLSVSSNPKAILLGGKGRLVRVISLTLSKRKMMDVSFYLLMVMILGYSIQTFMCLSMMTLNSQGKRKCSVL